MRVKEFEILDPSDPFKECLLNRKSFGHILTGLISGMEEGGVVSLNNEWGTGKSTFLKMWKQHLTNEGYITLEFNAWENDYEDNPLVPLISEIKDAIGKKDVGSFERILEVGGKLLIESGAMAVKKALNKIVGEGGVDSLVDIITGQAEEILKDEISIYKQKKDSLTEFKKLLGDYLASKIENPRLPLIFIIDELDRCRPDYAVKVLESVKHMFSVPNIVFIVSIDKTQLMHSINGFYGSENINSEEYLRRFFDLEISLPDPDKVAFINILLKEHNIEYILNEQRIESRYVDWYIQIINELLKSATLRRIQKYVTYLSVVLKSRRLNKDSYALFMYLLYLKMFRSQVYAEVSSLRLPLDKIASLFQELSTHIINPRTAETLELDFGVAYNNMLERDYNRWTMMYYQSGNPDESFRYTSLINKEFKERYLNDARRSSIQYLDTIFKTIDLV